MKTEVQSLLVGLQDFSLFPGSNGKPMKCFIGFSTLGLYDQIRVLKLLLRLKC